MPEKKPTGPNADELAKNLKAALAQRRPRPWKAILAALALSTFALILFAVVLYPRRPPEPLQVLALDALATPDEVLHISARLMAPANDTSPRSLHKHKIVFHEPPAIFQGADKPREVSGSSDERGQALVDWETPKKAIAEFQATYIDLTARPARHTDHARIFVTPARTPILVVDTDDLLSADVVNEKAAAKLSEAAKDGWQIVYLAPAAAKPRAFSKARERLTQQPKLPRGPILGRFHAPTADTVEAARRELLQSIRTRFQGPIQALVNSAAAAQSSKEAGVNTILIGAADAPAGVLRVASWSDVPLRLDK